MELRVPSLRILVIEDHPDGRETLRLLLEILGHQVEVAADGLEGVEKALALRPDVALVDIGLPVLNGYQVARQLRATLGRRPFLIAQTGYGRSEDRQRVLAAGFDVHLIKPVMPEELNYWLAVAAERLGASDHPEPSAYQVPTQGAAVANGAAVPA
jgi:CheY-like chemotaxis protein